MKKLFVFIILIINYSIIFSQVDENNNSENSIRNLKGTIAINMNAGFKVNSNNTTKATFGEVKAEIDFIGSIGYQYWFASQWAANATIGLFHAKAKIEYTNVTSIDINTFLFGISFYPATFTLEDFGRIHFGINAGLYRVIGTKPGVNVHNTNICSTSIEEAVICVEPNAGIDFFVLKWIKIGPAISYHFVGDFDEVIGDRKNYSGPVFSINVGLLL